MSAFIILVVVAIVLLYLGLFKAKNVLFPIALFGLLVAFCAISLEWDTHAQPIFSNMMLFDHFAVAFSALCIFLTFLILLISKNYFEKISQHVAEYYAIIFFALAGVIVMVSYYNLSMLFIGIETMSVSLYILVAIRKKESVSNEAALKYFLQGAFSTGFLLFGISLIYGATGSFDLEIIKHYVLSNFSSISSLFYSGMILMLIGFFFKIGVVPFHFWVPDVYEGSPTLITAFMSTVAKTAAFAAFIRLFSCCFTPLSNFWMPAIIVIIVLTILISNITAVYQRSFKRMLAYSSISHAGYLLITTLALSTPSISLNAVFAYVTAYSVASIIAFVVLILVKDHTNSSHFDSFNGLAKKNPFVAFALTVSMISLAGIPLTAGFIGKFMLFCIVIVEYKIWLIIFFVLNAIISVFYYLKVVIAMYFKDTDREKIFVSSYFELVLGASATIIIFLGMYPDFILNLF